MDVIRENHKFLWTEDDDPDETWYACTDMMKFYVCSSGMFFLMG